MNCNSKMARNGCISAVFCGFRRFCRPFLDVEGDGEEGKVHCDLVFSEVPEPPVCHVVFHLPEHGLVILYEQGANLVQHMPGGLLVDFDVAGKLA